MKLFCSAGNASPAPRTVSRPRPAFSPLRARPFGRVPQLLCSFRFTSLRRRLRTLTTAQGKIHCLTFSSLKIFRSSVLLFFVDLIRQATHLPFRTCCNQALDRLVSSSCTHCCASADDLSPGSLPGVLLLSDGSLILEVGFTLRCFQRLSHPHFASLLCRWHDNSCTSGASIPVLSY